MKILSMKGGGIRGLLTAKIGGRLDQAIPGWADSAQVIAGTSTGGILALGLAYGLSWRELADLYEVNASRIFSDSFWDNVLDVVVGGSSLRGAQYGGDGLHEVLRETFGDATLGELGRDVLIPAWDLDNLGQDRSGKECMRRSKAVFFTRQKYPNAKLVDVARATSAAPTYFPVYKGYADGGLFANDPAIDALAYVFGERVENVPAYLMSHPALLVSLGTGIVPRYVEGEDDQDWGLMSWARHLVDGFIDGSMGTSAYMSRSVLKGNFLEIDPELPRAIAMDGDAYKRDDSLQQALADLVAVAEELDLCAEVRWLDKRWNA